MEQWVYTWIPIIVVFFILYYLRRKKRWIISHSVIKKKMMRENAKKEKEIMKELAQRFIGKDCYINLIEGNADGVMTEITDGGIVLEKDNQTQIINLDYVVKIREYPYKKGKRQICVGD